MVGVNSETLWRWLSGTKKATNNAYRRKNSTKKKKERCDKNKDNQQEKEEIEERKDNKHGEEEINNDNEGLKLKIGNKKETEEEEEEEEEEENEEEKKRDRERFLSLITHLHLENKSITHIENVSCCRVARVAYLQHNHLTRLSNLRPLRLLQELYLHHNHITRLECLKELVSLRRLLVPGNRIGVVEGLPVRLQELHVQNQRLPPGDALVLDPHALASVQETLRVLDISGNKLTEIGAVGLLTRLQVLRACDNEMVSLRHVCAVVGRLRHMREISLIGNPVTANRRYRNALVLAASHTLEVLDGREVTSNSREFLIQAHQHRIIVRKNTTAKTNQGQTNQSAPSNLTNTKQQTNSTHLIFTPTNPSYQHDDMLTPGPRYVLGALRRPEFDLILKRWEKHARPPVSELDGDAPEVDFGAYASGHDSSGDEFTDATDERDTHTTHWSPTSSAEPTVTQERSVWFAKNEETNCEDLPRLIPRPYWRNKSPVPRINVLHG